MEKTCTQKKQQRNNRMTKTQGKAKKKYGGDRDEYSRQQQQEHRQGDININEDYITVKAREPLNDLPSQADEGGMIMPSIQNQQHHGTPAEEFAADPFGRISVPHDNDV
jgi:hypothetical protein